MSTVRDLAIIVLAVESIVVGVLLAVLILQIRDLIKLLEEEVRPILDSARKTVGTMQGTANVVSETVVTPLVQISGYISAIREVARILTRRRRFRERRKGDG